MKKTIVSAVCGLALCAAMIPLEAIAAKHPKSNPGSQLREQKVRIKEGVKNGTLTRKEAKQLKAETKAFRGEVKAAKAGGKIDPQEREKLTAELNRLRDEISAREGNQTAK